MRAHYTTRELAEELGPDEWRIRRLFELGVLNEPPRLGRYRIIAADQVPQIVAALQARGWLPSETTATK